ncbi:hypothetical protein TA3x_004253 [Tundrisphaera sp. TA3]|uniref:hypothetical protein n=1 Tax=Tundrisphaera sp. TA3 TaxID=3435775 RepID=UPI003EB6F6B2
MMAEKLFTMFDVAVASGVCTATVQRHAKEGKLPAFDSVAGNGKYFWSEDSFKKIVASFKGSRWSRKSNAKNEE